MAYGDNPGPVTSNRKTHFILDAHDPVMMEPTFGMSRDVIHMSTEKPTGTLNVHLLEGLGWTLMPLNHNHDGFAFERQSVQDQYQQSADLNVAPGWEQINISRKALELTNAYSGSSPDYLTGSGGIFFRKKVGQGLDWDDASFMLSADEAAFPRPDPTEETGKLDRVASAPDLYDPSRPIQFMVVMPGAGREFTGPVATLYFAGPAGKNSACAGYGQYAVRINSHGHFHLFERGVLADTTVGWCERRWFRIPTAIGGLSFYQLKVFPNPNRSKRNPDGSITFQFAAPGGGDPVVELAISTGLQMIGGDQIFYRVINSEDDHNLAIHQCPIRVDMRRDKRGMFAVLLGKYETEGFYIDKPFSLAFYPTLSREFTVTAYGKIPTGTQMIPHLYLGKDPDSLTECTLVSQAQLGPHAWQAIYTVPVPADLNDPPNCFFVGVEMTGDGTVTPTLTDYTVIRDGLIQTVTPTEIDLLVARAARTLNTTTLEQVDITGPGDDPTHESAVTIVQDPLARLDTPLQIRSGMCVRVETEYVAGDASKRCILHRGYVTTARALHRKRKNANYPAPGWKEYEIATDGPWSRLETIFPPHAFVWAMDPTATPGPNGVPPPFKVTDVIQSALSWAGFTSNDGAYPEAEWMCDIGTGTNNDLPIRLFNSGEMDKMQVNVGASIAQLIHDLAYDYLGMAVVFDANRGTFGKWTLIPAHRPPYKIVANFLSTDSDSAVISGTKLRHMLVSYADKTISASATTQAGTAPSCYIMRDTLHTEIIPPEANLFEVSGSRFLPIDGMPALLGSVMVNPKSFDFYGVATSDPASPEYIGHIKQVIRVDQFLATEEAVAFAARRLYEIAGVALKVVRFSAPLLLVPYPDSDEATNADITGKKRPLMFGDPILIDGVPYLVDNVSFRYSVDPVQEMVVEAFQPRKPWDPNP